MFNLNEMMVHIIRDAFALVKLPAVDAPAFATNYKSGPGKKTIHSIHARIGRSCYMPHQGTQECARRVRQMEKAWLKLA